MRIILLLLVLASFAGCVGDEPSTQSTADAGDEPWSAEAYQTNASIDWMVGFGVGTPAIAYFNNLASGGSAVGEFNVDANATHLHLTSSWSCVSPACDLRIAVYNGDEFMGDATGSSSVEFAVDDAAGGDWWFQMWPAYGASVVVEAAGSTEVLVKYGASAMADEHDQE